MTKRSRSFLLISLLLLVTVSARTAAELEISCWDAAAEFNDSANPDAANPSGVWSYGWKKTVTGNFFLARTPFNDPPDRFGWCNASGYPLIYHSSQSVAALMNGPNRHSVPTRALRLHPGLDGEYAVVRFTAPAEGTYKLSGQFYALSDHGTGTTTGVWILKNNAKVDAFSGRMDYRGGATWSSFTGKVIMLHKSDTLDFEVGYGDHKSYPYDSAGLAAIIEQVK